MATFIFTSALPFTMRCKTLCLVNLNISFAQDYLPGFLKPLEPANSSFVSNAVIGPI